VKPGGLFRRGKRVDEGALGRALAAPVPEGAPDVPLEQRLPLPDATWMLVTHAAWVTFVLAFAWLQDPGYRPTALEVFLVASALLVIGVSSLLGGGLNPERALRISGEGIGVHRMFTSMLVPWWNVRRVFARPDLAEVRVDATPATVVMRLGSLPEEARAGVISAIRARLPEGFAIEQSPTGLPGRVLVVNALGVLGSVGLVASLYLTPFLGGGTLGIRCSGPSAYLDDRFGLAPGQGCVVIRVSGAAARAGVQQGDRMIAMNGAPITSGVQFNNRFFDENANRYSLTLVRPGVAEPVEIAFSLRGSTAPRSAEADPLTWFLRARGNPNTAQSIEQYGRAIEFAPDFDLAYLYRGELLLNSGDFTERQAALTDIQRALELNPGSAEANRLMAIYYSGEIFVDPELPKLYMARAIELHRCADAFTRQNVDCEIDYVEYASLLRFGTETQASIDAAQKALSYYPASAAPLYEMALSYEVLRDKDSARAYAQRYLAAETRDKGSSETKAMRALLTRLDRAS